MTLRESMCMLPGPGVWAGDVDGHNTLGVFPKEELMRVFEVKLKVVIDDIEPKEEKAITSAAVKKWVKEHFDGCDLARVIIGPVAETTKRRSNR